MVKNVMTLKSCSPIVGADVMSFDTEKEVLLAWKVKTVQNAMFRGLLSLFITQRCFQIDLVHIVFMIGFSSYFVCSC